MNEQIKRASGNPFVVYGYEGPEYFCDREKETKELISALENGRNITFIAPRRIGKTGVIHHAFNRVRKENPDIVCIYCDILNTKDKREFLQTFGSSIMSAINDQNQSLFSKLLTALASLRPTMSIDPLTSLPTFSVSVEAKKSDETLQSLLNFIKTSGKTCYIAIDEFQQITDYEDNNIEALLRSYIQFIPNAKFIFAGSSKHILSEMFLSSSRPFYMSTQIMNLEPIDRDTYYAFAQSFFQKRNGSLGKEVFRWIYDTFDGQTLYVQILLNRLYEAHTTIDDVHIAQQMLHDVAMEYANLYQSMIRLLPSRQYSLLKAIAREGIVDKPNSEEFITKYGLGSLSSNNSALKALEEKELIYLTKQGYTVYDKLLSYWLQTL